MKKYILGLICTVIAVSIWSWTGIAGLIIFLLGYFVGAAVVILLGD
jgi:hypothetical protein